jgi:hypothetical protein
MTRQQFSTLAIARHAAVFAVGALAASLALAQGMKPKPTEPSAPPDKTAIEAAFTRADANGDGKLSREELTRMPAIADKFDAFDKNKDGFLSPEEFAAGVMAGQK